MRSLIRNATLAIPAILWSLSFAAIPPKTLPNEADVSLSGIYLLDSASAIKVLGPNIVLSEMNSRVPGYPEAQYLNRDQTELLTLIFHPGDEKHCFAEIVVQKMRWKKSERMKVLPMDSFVSGKGVRIGMSKKELFQILPETFATGDEKGESIVEYLINPASSFLDNYNMPQYKGEYYFLKGKLTDFRFGFTYP
jgi:hypothetical protein